MELITHMHPIVDADVQFVVDPVARTVTNLSKKTVLMQFDHNSERFSFDLDRYVEGHDMTLCNRIEIHYINIKSSSKEKNLGVYEVEDLQVNPEDENKVTFSWLVSQNATQYAGTLNFLILFACVEEGVSLYRWSTGINTSITISTGLDCTDVIEETYPDILAQWKYELFSKNLAYEAAVENGFEGTITDWLASLKGDKGDDGFGIHVGPVEPELSPYVWFNTSAYETGENMKVAAHIDGTEYFVMNAAVEATDTAEGDYNFDIEE